MPTGYTTAQVVQAVEQRPERWQNVTRESALSLPVPLRSAGEERLAFFWYPMGGPIQNRVVGAPTHRVLANLNRLDDITFLPAGPADLGLGVAPGTPLGKPTVGGPVAAGEMKALKAELFETLDSLMNVALAASPLWGDQLEEAARLHALFYRLAIVALLPAYRSLNPEFFAWLDRYGSALP